MSCSSCDNYEQDNLKQYACPALLGLGAAVIVGVLSYVVLMYIKGISKKMKMYLPLVLGAGSGIVIAYLINEGEIPTPDFCAKL